MTQKPLAADLCNKIFFQCIHDYHTKDSVDAEMVNPYKLDEEFIENLLYHKNWIDTVQWHLEDIIRDPEIDPVEGIKIKRRIDRSNQMRNDTVEKIDEWLLKAFEKLLIKKTSNAKMNSESPAWIIDRLSILCLKIYHMEVEIERTDASPEHRVSCARKLDLLSQQLADLTNCFNELMEEIIQGDKFMKVYRQMKMYNDPSMNPTLYKNAPK
ncbi:MAG: DUF4254 domain-containing protein [Spirochaetia bacterium]|nr:DUF4254 domain-containing protein [Spirochaetia bacterium]